MSKKKRIEINKKVGSARVRVSRTSGVSASVSPAKGVTLNTKHGARVSKTYKGFTVGLQNFNTVVRGRWSSKDDKVNLNLSKSGASVSMKNSVGTLNLTNINRSSANIAGVQIRGKNAAYFAIFGLFFDAVFKLIYWLILLAHRLILLLAWLAVMAWEVSKLTFSLLVFLLVDLPSQLMNKQKEKA